MIEVKISEKEFNELDIYETRLLAFYRLLHAQGEKHVTVRETVRRTKISTNKVLESRGKLADKGYIEKFRYVRGAEINLK